MALLGAFDSFGSSLHSSLLAYWFFVVYGASLSDIGPLFAISNLIGSLTLIFGAKLADRIGNVNATVITHLPAPLLLMLMPFAPDFHTAAIIQVLRQAISRMDNPIKQSYMMARRAARGARPGARVHHGFSKVLRLLQSERGGVHDVGCLYLFTLLPWRRDPVYPRHLVLFHLPRPKAARRAVGAGVELSANRGGSRRERDKNEAMTTRKVQSSMFNVFRSFINRANTNSDFEPVRQTQGGLER